MANMHKKMSGFKIGTHGVGAEFPPFVIAEMSGNHNQSLEKALQIVDAAARAGVNALKIQTYTADTMTLNIGTNEFLIQDPKSLWNGRTLYDLYQEAYTPWEWHKAIFDRCKEHGIIGFSSPFDHTAVEYLENLGVEIFKIASFEIVDIPLIKKVAKTKKPIFISTGMATVSEIEEAVTAARSEGAEHIVLLKCTSTYPASPANTNILTIPHMAQAFGTEVGISDHTMGVGVSVAAVALGATVIEKHFTLSRAEGGVDSAFSLEPEELRSLVLDSKRAWESLGQVSYGPTEKERPSLQFRRSVYITKDMRAGETISPNNLRIIRPGLGLAPKYYNHLIGRVINRDVKMGTPVTWDLFT